MRNASDIPDWIPAMAFNRELDLSGYSAEDVKALHEKSPISKVSEVKTPTLILLGDSDFRVPPHQAHNYYNALK